MRDVGKMPPGGIFFRFRPQKWTYLKLPLIEKMRALLALGRLGARRTTALAQYVGVNNLKL